MSGRKRVKTTLGGLTKRSLRRAGAISLAFTFSLLLASCPSMLQEPEFDNPFDPGNPDSPFHASVEASTTEPVYSEDSTVTVVFAWSTVEDATGYDFQWSYGDSFEQSPIISVDRPQHAVNGMQNNRTVRWRVRYHAEALPDGRSEPVSAQSDWFGPWSLVLTTENPDNDSPDDPDDPDDPDPGLVDGRLSMTGTINGTPVSVDAADANVYLYNDGTELRLTTPGGDHGIEFRDLAALAGPGYYDISEQLHNELGVWSEAIFGPAFGYNNLPVVSGELRLIQANGDAWSGDFTYSNGGNEISCSVSGSFGFNPEGLALPEAAYVYEIPTGTVTVDGDLGDWGDIEPQVLDDAGDSELGLDHTDIRIVYLARDDNYLYWRMDLGDRPDLAGELVSYRLNMFPETDDVSLEGRYELSVLVGNNRVEPRLAVMDADETWQTIEVPSSYGAADLVIEGKLPLAYFAEHRYTRNMWAVWSEGDRDVADQRPLDFQYTGDQSIPEETAGTLSATGVIRGAQVLIDGAISTIEPGGADGGVHLELHSEHAESVGKYVAVDFNLTGITPGRYTMPAVGASGLRAMVGSELIMESEGYGGNGVDDDSEIVFDTVADDRVTGTFSLNTYIDDTLSGSFDIPLRNWSSASAQSPPDGGVIETRTITIDGEPGDWWTREYPDGSLIIDHTGDSDYVGIGGDVTGLRLAADAENLYFLIDLADDTPSTTGEFDYRVWISNASLEETTNNIELGLGYGEGSWGVHAFERDSAGVWHDLSGVQPEWGAVGSVIELKIPRSAISLPEPWAIRGHLQHKTLAAPPDGTDYWLFSAP